MPDCLKRVRKRTGPETLLLQLKFNQFAKVRLIIDYQDRVFGLGVKVEDSLMI